MQKKILIVDDSLLGRVSLKNQLSEYKHRILEAANGKEALVLLEKEKPDLIFLDLLMPEMDGMEVLKRMGEMKNRTTVIIVSADIQKTTREKCLKLGAVDFANKPMEENQMDELLAAYLERE